MTRALWIAGAAGAVALAVLWHLSVEPGARADGREGLLRACLMATFVLLAAAALARSGAFQAAAPWAAWLAAGAALAYLAFAVLILTGTP
ncbi:hypothetical protein DXV76_16690 [Rhodobacteraceae bacterium CCMM004]|nr:hypothetical protein DXV76_16690 [Rhodobacteraceae bacterium CCMM004]